MNDINILTFWGVPNYGTFAQAYALQASIQKAYPEYDVKQINYLCQKHYKQYYSKYPIDPIWKKNFYKSLVIYALSDFLIMILSWLVKQSLRAFLFQEVQL